MRLVNLIPQSIRSVLFIINRHCLVQKAGYTGFRDSGFYPVNVFAAAYAIDKYLNKNDTPEETLRRAIVKGEIVPFINLS